MRIVCLAVSIFLASAMLPSRSVSQEGGKAAATSDSFEKRKARDFRILKTAFPGLRKYIKQKYGNDWVPPPTSKYGVKPENELALEKAFTPGWFLGRGTRCSVQKKTVRFAVLRYVEDFLLFFDKDDRILAYWELPVDLRRIDADGCKVILLERAKQHGDTAETFAKVERKVVVDLLKTEPGAKISIIDSEHIVPKWK